MNNQQKQQLEKLQSKWNLNCKTAVNNKVSYVLRRSRKDYLRVMGSEGGLENYQTEVLEQVSGIGTHREVAIIERQRVADIVLDAFGNVEPDTVVGYIGSGVIDEVMGGMKSVAISVEEERIENFNPFTGIVPGPVSAMSSVSMQSYQPMFSQLEYVVDHTSPSNVYTRDMLKNMGLLKKVRSLNWKKVGAMSGAMTAVGLVCLGTSVSAYATVTSDELYNMTHTSTYMYEDEAQSLSVPATASKPIMYDRMNDIYMPDMIWPTVDGAGVVISSGFGYRSAPCEACSSDHRGLDMNPGVGTEVYSATDGTVVLVGWDGSLGWNVLVQDGGNREYAYGHMIADSSPADIYVGAKVKQGQLLGQVGCTGICTGPHLHFEIREDGVKIDPLPELLRWAH